MIILLKAWSVYLRMAAKFPILQTILPFIPLVIAWALVTAPSMSSTPLALSPTKAF